MLKRIFLFLLFTGILFAQTAQEINKLKQKYNINMLYASLQQMIIFRIKCEYPDSPYIKKTMCDMFEKNKDKVLNIMKYNNLSKDQVNAYALKKVIPELIQIYSKNNFGKNEGYPDNIVADRIFLVQKLKKLKQKLESSD